MKTIRNLLETSLFACIFALAACSDSSEDAINNTLQDPELNGRYTSACGASDLLDLSMRETFRFEADGTLTRYQEFYQEADCSDAEILGTVTLSGSFAVDKETSTDFVGSRIKIDLSEAYVKASKPLMVDALNTVNFCGANDYSLNNEVAISGGTGDLTCPVQDVPAVLYGVYREDDGDLYFNEGGLSSMAQDPQERPQTIDQEVVYAKQ